MPAEPTTALQTSQAPEKASVAHATTPSPTQFPRSSLSQDEPNGRPHLGGEDDCDG